MMASQLHRIKLDVAPAIGKGAAAEFAAFLKLYANLPNIAQILAGEGKSIEFPKEPSVRYATTIALAIRAADATQAYEAFLWLTNVAGAEWVQLFAVDMFRSMRRKKQIAEIAILIQKDPELQKFLKDFQDLTTT